MLIERIGKENGVPDAVEILNTPLDWTDRLNADLGVFAQDGWTLKRLTVNFGARWEYFNSEVSASSAGAGRFAPARSFDRIPMPVWKDIAPRFGVVYNLTGDAKTAMEIQRKLMPVHKWLFVEANPIPLKWAMARMGLCGDTLRLPYQVLESERIAEQVAAASVELAVRHSPVALVVPKGILE